MRALVLLGAALLAGGCATRAEHEGDRIVSSLQADVQRAKECWAKAEASDVFQSLKGKLPAPIETPSMDMMTNQEKPTPEESVRLLSYHREQLNPCRQAVVRDLGNTHPALQSVIASSYAGYDASYAQLVMAKLTWGEFATDLNQRRQAHQAKWDEAGRMIGAQLQNAHRYEVQQRQAAATAFSQWAYQQQVIAALSRPVTTNCFRNGAYVNCTSY